MNEIRYGFLLPNGSLARISSEYNGDDRYACGSHKYHLTDDDDCPVFIVESPDKLAKILYKNTPWYNTDNQCPGWGEYSKKDLTPVEIIQSFKKIEIPEPFEVGKIVDTRDIPYAIAKQYFKDAREGEKYVWCLIDGENIDEYKKRIGQLVHYGSYTSKRRLYAVVSKDEMPEEWADACKNPIILICSIMVYE